MSARLLLWRWSLRVLRREWRQHAMIFALILAGVGLSVGGALTAYNLVEPPQSDFGDGQFAATTSQPEQLADALRAQGHPFAVVDSATVLQDGTAAPVAVRNTDPDNPVSSPLVALRGGRWPAADDEVALTDRALLDPPALGSTVELGGTTLRVVGQVENPTALSDEFALVADVAAIAAADSDITTELLIAADPSSVDASSVPDLGVSTTDGPAARTGLTLIVNVVGALGMLEIALLIGSAFAVIARRRSRQLGLLAAAGATPQLVRTAATTTGTILGLGAAVLGLGGGVAVTSLIVPAMETFVGHRIDFAVPLWAVVPNVVVAVLVASLAARWPSRALSRRPVVELLAARRPRVEPVVRAATVGVVMAGVGGVALVAGFARVSLPLALLGTLVAPVGLLLTSPLLVRLLGRVATGMPLSERLAGRALARYNRRSAAVVAALALALAIPIGIAAVTTSIDRRAEATGPNLAPEWAIAWAPGANDHLPRLPADRDPARMEMGREALSEAAPDLEIVPVQMAIPSDAPVEAWDFPTLGHAPSVAPVVAGRRLDVECRFCDVDAYSFGERDQDSKEISYRVEPAWVTSPRLLEALGLDPSSLDGAAALVADEGYLAASIEGVLAGTDRVSVSPEWPRNTTVPPVLLSPELVGGDGFDLVTVGWMGVSDGPIPRKTQDAIRRSATDLRVELHQPPEPKSGLRVTGLLLGLAVGLGIAISAVVLLSAELSDDLALLASLGARPRTGRRLSAALAAMLAGVGALLAVLIGYLPLLPMVTSPADGFPFVVPWPTLAGLLVLFPTVAGAVGWQTSRSTTRGMALRDSV